MKGKLWQIWILVGIVLIAGVVTTLAEPMGMLSTSTTSDPAIYERDWIWGTGIAMWGIIGIGIWRV